MTTHELISRLKYKTTIGYNPLEKKVYLDKYAEETKHIGIIKDHLDSLIQSGELDCNVNELWPQIDEQDLYTTHKKEYIKALKASCFMGQPDLDSFFASFKNFYLTSDSFPAAVQGCTVCRFLAEFIMEARIPNAFALVRPFGHNADSETPANGCLVNNAALAAEAAFNFGADRILILDLSPYHGSGTQRLFYDDKRILHISVHIEGEHSEIGQNGESNPQNTGSGEGEGYNVNIRLPKEKYSDYDFIKIFFNVIWPIASDFNPSIVIVPVGFDGAFGVSKNLLPHLTYHLKALAKGKLLMVLEDLGEIIDSAERIERIVRVLAGSPPLPLVTTPSVISCSTLASLDIIDLHKRTWPALGFHLKCQQRVNEFEFNPKEATVYPLSLSSVNPEEPDDATKTGGEKFKTYVYYNSDDALHKNSQKHPERPERTKQIIEKLQADGHAAKCEMVINQRRATDEEILQVHDAHYLVNLKRTQQMTEEELRARESQCDSVYLTNSSFDIAAKAVGAVLECVDRVLEGKKSPLGFANAFAVIRPPGHHAGLSAPSGFCLLNNVAIATEYAMKKYGSKRVLIVDWDVHHGNGTQDIFHTNENVLYISIHRHEQGGFYPMGEPKDYMNVGLGKGRGKTVNIPFSRGIMGNHEYEIAFTKIIMPIAYEFNPDLVFISAGFDAALGDPLGEYEITAQFYGLMTHFLGSLAGGRMVTVLEGGYNIDVISQCASAVCDTMLNRSAKKDFWNHASGDRVISYNALRTLQDVLNTQIDYWPILKGFQVVKAYAPSPSISGSSNQPSPQRTPPMADDDEPNFGALHCVVPLPSCPHLCQVNPVPETGIDIESDCLLCPIRAEIWICLCCYQPHCGRHINQHALIHFMSSQHPMALSLTDLAVWCYVCDAYVHNDVLYPAKNEVHQKKFGVAIPQSDPQPE